MDNSQVYLLTKELLSHLEQQEILGIPNEWLHANNEFDNLLDSLEQECLSCTKCRLSENRNKVVFGVGAKYNPIIAFVGEGPGADEDRIGEPFVGKAGALLTAAITKGMGLSREDVYICNVVKCRPPNNRTPLPDEIASCVPYLYRQLEALKPRVIVALGGPAQNAISGVDKGITKIRGTWQTWRGIPVMPTYHPAYLLRNPSAKREFWIDLQEVMKEIGIN
jgi:uracil-DNA glycosylase